MGREEEVEEMTTSLSFQWDLLLERIRDKTQKLREANQQQQFNQASVCVCHCVYISVCGSNLLLNCLQLVCHTVCE